MQTASTIARLTLLAVGVAGALAAADAAAAFQLKENSAKGLGRAFAGSTSTEATPRSSHHPASMRLLDGTLQGDVSAISFGPSSAARASTPTARRFPAATAATP
jgi:long-chain fatty acid transport protein